MSNKHTGKQSDYRSSTVCFYVPCCSVPSGYCSRQSVWKDYWNHIKFNSTCAHRHVNGNWFSWNCSRRTEGNKKANQREKVFAFIRFFLDLFRFLLNLMLDTSFIETHYYYVGYDGTLNKCFQWQMFCMLLNRLKPEYLHIFVMFDWTRRHCIKKDIHPRSSVFVPQLQLFFFLNNRIEKRKRYEHFFPRFVLFTRRI